MGINELFSTGANIFRNLTRQDGFENVVTALGTRERDKAASTTFERIDNLTDQAYEDLYSGDFIARKIVSMVIEEAMGEGFTVSRKTEEGEPAPAEQVKQLNDALDRFDVMNKIVEVAIWGRLYGRSALYLVFAGEEQDTEVDPELAGDLIDLIVLEKRDYSAFSFFDISLEPEQWILTTNDKNVGSYVHTSRLIPFGGARTPRRAVVQMDWSDYSVLHHVLRALADQGMNWRAVVHRMQDASQGVFRLKGLFDMITGSEDGLANLKKRMVITDMARSVARALLLDADEESFEYQEIGFQNVPEIMGVSMQIVAAAASVPMTKLFGVPSAGLGSEDINGTRNWNKQLVLTQELKLRKPLERVVNLVARAEGLGDGWEVVFPSPITMTPSEEAQLRQSVATTDVAYINAGVYVAEEVALVRAQPDGYMRDIEIDLELREQLLSLSLDNKKELAENPPTFGAEDPEAGSEDDPESTEDPESDGKGSDDDKDPEKPEEEEEE